MPSPNSMYITLNLVTDRALFKIAKERESQEVLRVDRQWGSLESENYHVLNTVFGEEVGEVAKALLELTRVPADMVPTRVKRLRELRDEAIQAAAVASQIAEKAMLELDALGGY